MKQEPRERQLYTYDGAVLCFETVVANHFQASTYAVSQRQAASNIVCQYKHKQGLSMRANIKLAKLPTIATSVTA